MLSDPTMEAGTVVVANARLELLRGLRYCREELSGEHHPTHFPAFCGEWKNSRADILLAIKECAALGEIEAVYPQALVDRLLEGPMLRLTDKGLDWIRTHDALGEVEQEFAARTSRPTTEGGDGNA